MYVKKGKVVPVLFFKLITTPRRRIGALKLAPLIL
jgi:hypothetical protein